MNTNRLLSLFAGLLLAAGLMALPAIAAPLQQGGNLVQDPAFDLAAQGNWKWEKWSYQNQVIQPGGKNEPDLEQSFYAPVFVPSEAKWDHTSGGDSGAAAAISAGKINTKFRAGFYQKVQVGKGARVRFSIWANEFCRYGDGACAVVLKAGIDPTGGTDWSSANIQWAGAEVSNNRYVRLVTAEVTAGDSGQVTIFTWGEPLAPGQYTAAYFDDAELTTATGTAATSAAPTTAPAAGAPVTATQPAAPGGECAQLRWVSDVTIPDDSPMAPGAKFVKTWRVKNSGTCVFTGTLVFVGKGNQMGGASPINLPGIEAGKEADVSVSLTAPTQAGDAFGTWQPRTTSGTAQENLVVRIKVQAGAVTPIPAVTATLAATRPVTVTATLAPVVTATPQRSALPTPPSPPTTGEICVQAYNDLNGDGQQGADESLLAGVAFVFSSASGPIDSYTTDGASEPHCFKNLALGVYQLTIKPPTGFAGTTPGATSINLTAGLKPTIAYGAKRSGAAPTPTANPAGQAAPGGGLSGTVRTVAIVIGVLVLAGLAIVGGMLLLARRQP